MLNWYSPDITFITENSGSFRSMRRAGSDTAPANIFLLGAKYNTEIAERDGAVFRYYNGSKPNRRGYGFPIAPEGANIARLVEIIERDAKQRGIPVEFCLCDERQRAALDAVRDIEWKCTDDDSDYIYKKESLASLSGKKLHRKRNHISKFMRTYDDVRYCTINRCNIGDAVNIAELWIKEREAVSADELGELESIRLAAKNFDALGLIGGIIYAGGTPAAMTIASRITEQVTDIHFEKSYGEYAENGGFAVINRIFAESLPEECDLINREEDMGIEGLRSAKESYYPAFRLKKYYGVCKC
ncbi:MAG: DUF2156 domain-containing protein [Ruminiclostridium sp.]|nr:DUF2156 domain-containing protein [Ruminiclostridium sp.]